jgi:hypothetical protein
MRFATIATVAAIAAAAAVPTYAAPSPNSQLTPAQFDQLMKIVASANGPSSVSARDYEELLARNNFTDMLKGIAQGLAGNFKTFVAPMLPIKREELELLARELDSISAREYNEMVARDFWSDFKQGFVQGFTGTLKTVGPIALSLLRREDMGLLAREHMDVFAREYNELYGRDFWSDFKTGFVQGFTGTLKTVGPIALSFLKREDMDVFARDYNELYGRDFWSDFKTGFVQGFTGTLKTVAPIALSFLKREEIELLAREL